MNKLSRKHHELKISYLRDRIKHLAHGFYGKYRGRRAVYITYDPGDLKTSRENKRKLSTSSRLGRRYSQQVDEYIELRNELRCLISDWKAMYTTAPRKIEFPLIKRRRDLLTREFFEEAAPNQNSYENEEPYEFKGQLFRSKNEVIAAQVIDELGYEFKTEIKVVFDKFSYICPDLTFYVPEADKVILLEIDGAIENEFYETKSYKTTAKLVVNGYVEGKDFVVVRVCRGNDIDPEQIRKMILSAIDASIDDI